jgi:hypothetical protein
MFASVCGIVALAILGASPLSDVLVNVVVKRGFFEYFGLELLDIVGLRVTVFLRPLSPCDLVQAESQLAARATPFRPSPLRHKRHSAKWAPNICCSDHLGCCVARTLHLPSFVFSRSLRSVFHTLAASMVLFRCSKWVAIRRAWIAVEGF